MMHYKTILLAMLAVATTAVTYAAPAPAEAVDVIISYRNVPGRKEADDLTRFGARIKHAYALIPAVAARMSPQAVAQLRQKWEVAYIEPDAIAYASAESIYWDVKKLTAPQTWSLGNTGVGAKVAIIDTGIDYQHADLAPNYKGGYNFVSKSLNPLDDHGHGTHVAGTIAAAANTVGIRGVAPGASLYGLKVLASSGSGTYSDIIAALQWCVNNRMNVACMSLGSPTGSMALHDACTAAYQGGVLLVAAAGNSGTATPTTSTIEYPAAYSSVIAVGATDVNNARPYWSSTGPALEISAPGMNIISDRVGGGLVMLSGTSMAAPHIVGVAALIVASGETRPPYIRKRLNSAATDLGLAGRDAIYGWGLAHAYRAVTRIF